MLQVRQETDRTLVVSLPKEEAVVLTSLPQRLRQLLAGNDFQNRVKARLFPPAYADAKLDQDYQRLMRNELAQHKILAVQTFEKTLAKVKERAGYTEIRITPAEFDLWLGFVNDMRLVLGMELDITEEDWRKEVDIDHPRFPDYALLHYLSWLEEELLAAI